MNLYFLRHGIAVERDDFDYANDAARQLTPKGKKQLRTTVAALRTMKIRFDTIFSSPLVRARQTAEILREVFDREKIRTEMRLTPTLTDPKALAKLLKEARGRDTVAVGHEPILSAWIGQMCFGQNGNLEMKKGALAALEWKAGSTATLLYLLQPGILRHL